MAYWTTKQRVLDSEQLLEQIAAALRERGEFSFRVKEDVSLQKARHRVMEILASAEEFPSLLEGRFAYLLRSVRSSIDRPARTVTLSLKVATAEQSFSDRAILSAPLPADMLEMIEEVKERVEGKRGTAAQRLLARLAENSAEHSSVSEANTANRESEPSARPDDEDFLEDFLSEPSAE